MNLFKGTSWGQYARAISLLLLVYYLLVIVIYWKILLQWWERVRRK